MRYLFTLLCFLLPLSAQATTPATHYYGINIAGAEFTPDKLPGTINKDYVYPSPAIMGVYASFGMNIVRVPFLWERLQPKLNDRFAPDELQRLDDVVKQAEKLKIHIILDAHNYGFYRGKPIGSSEVPTESFVAFWKTLATHYKTHALVIYGIMNEPNTHSANDWAAINKAVIAGIRSTGARQAILIPGTLYTGVHSWNKKTSAGSNAEALAKIKDSNLIIEFHHYFDSNFSGTHPDCHATEVTLSALANATVWLKQTKHKGFLAEFGTSKDAHCLEVMDAALNFISRKNKQWVGWTYWGASEWFGDYMYNIYPLKSETYPQLSILKKHIP